MPKVAVIAVRHPTDSQLFLHGLRKDTGQWNLIGGHFKSGETPDEAARRELQEESGITAPVDFAMDKHYGDHHVHLFYAKCPEDLKLDTSNDPDAEFLTFKWLNPSVHRNLHVPASRNILVDHMKSLITKSIEIDSSMFIDELEKNAPMHLDQIHPNGDKIAKLHPNGKLMWHSSKKIADNHDRILSSPEMTQNFLRTVPESHRGLMAGLISHVAKDPNRHFIPTEEGGTQKLRARHIKDLIYGGGDVKLDTSNPDILRITRNSHSQGVNSGAQIAFNFKRSGLGKSETNDRQRAAGTLRTIWDGSRFVSSLYTEGSNVHSGQSGQPNPQRNDSEYTTEGLEKGLRGDWQKEGYTLHHDEHEVSPNEYVPAVIARDKKGHQVAHLAYEPMNVNSLYPRHVNVDQEHQRKGIASAMYSFAENKHGKKFESGNRTDQSKALWDQPNRPFGKSEELNKSERLKLKIEPFSVHPDHFDPRKHDFVVHLHRGDEKLGFMAVTHKKEGIMPFQFEVSDEHRRKGHGTRIAAYAQILSNKKILTTPDQSPAYNKFKTRFDSKNKFKPSKS